MCVHILHYHFHTHQYLRIRLTIICNRTSLYEKIENGNHRISNHAYSGQYFTITSTSIAAQQISSVTSTIITSKSIITQLIATRDMLRTLIDVFCRESKRNDNDDSD